MYPVFVRLTIENTKEEVLQVLQTIPERYCKAIVCEEEASKHHLHVLSLTPEVNVKNSRQNIKNLLKKAFPILKDNAKWSISQCYTRTIDKMGSYVVKEGNFCYYGFSEEEVSEFKTKAYSKTQRTIKYQDELNSLNKEFMDHQIDMSMKCYIVKFFELRIKYNKPMSASCAETYFEHILTSRSRKYLQKRADWHEDRLHLHYL